MFAFARRGNSGSRLASTLSRAGLSLPRTPRPAPRPRRASAVVPSPLTTSAAAASCPLARPARDFSAARYGGIVDAAPSGSGGQWFDRFSWLCAATACVAASIAGLGFATNAEAAADESPTPPSPLATAAGVDGGGRSVLAMDMRKFEDAISNTADFRALVEFLESRHGIRLRQLVGVGSASVIFAAEKLGGGGGGRAGGAGDAGNDGVGDPSESQLVTIKVLDHDLVRSSAGSASRIGARWLRPCMHAMRGEAGC
jgi:hypothetical protein